MLLTYADYYTFSGSLLLNNGTKLKINCSKRNRLFIKYFTLFGVSEHLDKIEDEGL
jgi:hypothetical protein